MGGLFNLDIALHRIKAMPNNNFFLLLVDINNDYQLFWNMIFSVFERNDSLDIAKEDFIKVFKTVREWWGGGCCHPDFLRSQKNYDIIKKFIRENRAIFSCFDMSDPALSSKLRDIAEETGFHIDTYNVSNVARSSNKSHLRGGSDAKRFAPAVSKLVMSSTILIASRIYYRTFSNECDQLMTREFGCIQSMVVVKDTSKLPAILDNPQKFEDSNMYADDVRDLLNWSEKSNRCITGFLVQTVMFMPPQLLFPFFTMIFLRICSKDGFAMHILTLLAKNENFRMAIKERGLKSAQKALKFLMGKNLKLSETLEEISTILPTK